MRVQNLLRIKQSGQTSNIRNRQINDELETIRKHFSTIQPDNDLVNQVVQYCSTHKIPKAIFRRGLSSCRHDSVISSTNAEDLKGFNGAGLYDSVPVEDTSKPEEVAKAITTVWGSTWSLRGFLERDHAGIDSSQVGMAILVQPFLNSSDVLYNGVAITRNPFNPDKFGCIFATNVSGYHSRATESSTGGSEQVLIHLARVVGKLDLELIHSNDTPLMTLEDATNLSEILKNLHHSILKRSLLESPPFSNKDALDIEFLVKLDPAGHRRIVILQARPLK